MATTTATAAFPRELAIPVPSPPGFSDLYQAHADLVYRAALRVTGNAADAEDVLQTVFLRILHHQERLDPARPPESYLRRSATNAAIDIIRRRSVRSESSLDQGTQQHATLASEPLLKERLRRAIAQLPPRDAELFSLRYLEGLSNGELAELFGMEKASVAVRLHRIRQTLQEEMER
jgi:RNA polymerase sigma-70 factor, ECF subfamily